MYKKAHNGNMLEDRELRKGNLKQKMDNFQSQDAKIILMYILYVKIIQFGRLILRLIIIGNGSILNK